VKANLDVRQILTKKIKPFIDGELVKECMVMVPELMFLERRKQHLSCLFISSS
jgi:hypothetical protein